MHLLTLPISGPEEGRPASPPPPPLQLGGSPQGTVRREGASHEPQEGEKGWGRSAQPESPPLTSSCWSQDTPLNPPVRRLHLCAKGPGGSLSSQVWGLQWRLVNRQAVMQGAGDSPGATIPRTFRKGELGDRGTSTCAQGANVQLLQSSRAHPEAHSWQTVFPTLWLFHAENRTGQGPKHAAGEGS